MSAIRLITVLVSCTVITCPAIGQTTQSTGLIFTPKTQYESIPLASNPYSGSELPAAVDLSQYMPPPGDQQDQQSCVAWAVAYALKSFQEQRELKWSLTDPAGKPDYTRVFSPSYIYNQINNGMNVGTYFHNALNVLADEGAALWSDMPYTSYNAPIPNQARQNARRFRIDTWRRVNPQSTREVKAQLNAGFPVVIGAIVDQGFKQLQGSNASWTGSSGPEMGGHAMVAVGYDDARQAYRLLNSWGQQWGDGGYAWVSYEHFARVVGEAYVAQDARNGTPPIPEAEQVARVTEFQPPEQRAEQASLTVSEFTHNTALPGWGLGVTIKGMTNIPAGVSGSAQVVIRVVFGNGNVVQGLNPTYRMPDGQAATGSAVINLTGTAQTAAWQAFLPYCTLAVPKGQACLSFPIAPPQRSSLVAIPVLFINNFGAAEGTRMPFWVNL